jgi:hypothetical protein
MAGGSIVSRQGIPASAERGLFLRSPSFTTASRLIIPHQKITTIESKAAEVTNPIGYHVLTIEMKELSELEDMLKIRVWDSYCSRGTASRLRTTVEA